MTMMPISPPHRRRHYVRFDHFRTLIGISMKHASLGKLILVTLVLFLTVPRLASAAESYDNCTGFITSLPAVVTTQGTWCLKQDLATAITSGNAITINTGNVTIDCNDFKLGGMSAGLATQAIG